VTSPRKGRERPLTERISDPGNQGIQGKWSKQIPCREKSGNFKIKKIRELSGNFTKCKGKKCAPVASLHEIY